MLLLVTLQLVWYTPPGLMDIINKTRLTLSGLFFYLVYVWPVNKVALFAFNFASIWIHVLYFVIMSYHKHIRYFFTRQFHLLFLSSFIEALLCSADKQGVYTGAGRRPTMRKRFVSDPAPQVKLTNQLMLMWLLICLHCSVRSEHRQMVCVTSPLRWHPPPPPGWCFMSKPCRPCRGQGRKFPLNG